MAESLKRSFEQVSPSRSSPIGNRSPHQQLLSHNNMPRQDSSGTLKTTISLGRNPAVIQKGPFYLFKELPEKSEVTGALNLIAHHGLQSTYAKFCGKKTKEDLSSVLSLPGNINLSGADDNSSLRSVIDKPPITGRELLPLTSSQLVGFRLHPGQLPEQYRLFAPQKKKKKKAQKRESEHESLTPDVPAEPVEPNPGKKPKKTKEKGERKKDKKKKKRKEKDKGSP